MLAIQRGRIARQEVVHHQDHAARKMAEALLLIAAQQPEEAAAQIPQVCGTSRKEGVLHFGEQRNVFPKGHVHGALRRIQLRRDAVADVAKQSIVLQKLLVRTEDFSLILLRVVKGGKNGVQFVQGSRVRFFKQLKLFVLFGGRAMRFGNLIFERLEKIGGADCNSGRNGNPVVPGVWRLPFLLGLMRPHCALYQHV
ncbi:unknown [Clostridium sp. CAG:1024]|nr:unknown [Clostridium sp. CAG:1024]